jgi:hypothetical protein
MTVLNGAEVVVPPEFLGDPGGHLLRARAGQLDGGDDDGHRAPAHLPALDAASHLSVKIDMSDTSGMARSLTLPGRELRWRRRGCPRSPAPRPLRSLNASRNRPTAPRWNRSSSRSRPQRPADDLHGPVGRRDLHRARRDLHGGARVARHLAAPRHHQHPAQRHRGARLVEQRHAGRHPARVPLGASRPLRHARPGGALRHPGGAPGRQRRRRRGGAARRPQPPAHPRRPPAQPPRPDHGRPAQRRRPRARRDGDARPGVRGRAPRPPR